MNLLIVDDERNILKTTSIALESMGHHVHVADNLKQARSFLNEEPIDAMFLDIMLGSDNGLDFLRSLKEQGDDTPVIMFTAHSTIQLAVESMKLGAYDFIQKPFVPDQIRQMLDRLRRTMQLDNRVKNLESRVADDNPTLLLQSMEPAVQKAYDVAQKASSSDASILLLGPSGTGKSILARHIHDQSPRAQGRFVTINCPSLSKELLEGELFGHVKGAFTGAIRDTWGKVAAADNGTLFLDEIGELPLSIQPKLLRLLQERRYERVGETKTREANVRVIAATNRDLKQEVKEGRFREDLYYRLKVIEIWLPGLRDRTLDLIPIAERYLSFFSEQFRKEKLRFHPDTIEALVHYAWPGNLRELKNVIERAVILSESSSIMPVDLPDEFQRSDSDPENGDCDADYRLSAVEARHIQLILSQTGSLDEAARVLGIDPATLYRKRKKLGLA